VAKPKPTLDFVVIGAAKAGTTSLFEYLRTHPEVHLPSWKETNFFLDPRYARGVDWYLDWVLGGAPAGSVCGEASVRYMAGTPWRVSDEEESHRPSAADSEKSSLERVIPSRIHSALPQVKLVALLRDPVQRCVSEYGMAVLRGIEERPLDEAIADLLGPDQLEEDRTYFTDTGCYVVQSEYGRVLEPYFELFGREQILVLFTSELAADPKATVQRVYDYLGVTADFVPPNLGVRYLEGAERPRWRALDLPRMSRALRRNEALRGAWRRLPSSLRRRAWTSTYKVEKWNRATGAEKKKVEVSPEVEAALRSHFGPDGALLTSLTGLELPWA
jgi:hypothetical protein